MKTITQYREDVNALMKKVGDIDAKATHENRDLNEAELALREDILDAVEDLHKTISSMERQERLSAKLSQPAERQTVENKKDLAPRIEVADNRTKDKFSSLGQQLSAIMRAGAPGGNIDPRLFNATGLNTTTPSDGGFLIQQEFATELANNVFDSGQVASRCRQIPISGNANGTKINGVDETSRVDGSRYGGIRGYWASEAEEKTASKPKFRQIELSLKKLIGLCYATDEMLEDAAQLENVIRQGFVDEFAFKLDDSIINGTGAGMPLGILNAGCLVTQAAEGGQGANTVVGENVMKMWARLFPKSKQNAVWFINPAVEPQLMQMVAGKVFGSDTAAIGGLVYMPAGGLSQAPYGTLFGRPVIPIEQCQQLGTAGDIILADMSGYYLARKGGMQSDMSIHVRFVYDESVFRFVMRVDGQPMRATALTPYKGSDTLSHFVALNSSRT